MSESLPTTFVVVDQRGEHVSGPFDTNLGAIAARRTAARRSAAAIRSSISWRVSGNVSSFRSRGGGMADNCARATASNERCTDRILGFGLGRCFREQGKREAATDSQDDLEQSFGSGPWTRCFAWKMLLSSHESGAAWYMAMDVGDWLRSLGLGKYEATFRDSEIDSDILHELTESDLEKLGLPLGHRKRLLKAIVGLGAAATAPSTATLRLGE